MCDKIPQDIDQSAVCTPCPQDVDFKAQPPVNPDFKSDWGSSCQSWGDNGAYADKAETKKFLQHKHRRYLVVMSVLLFIIFGLVSYIVYMDTTNSVTPQCASTRPNLNVTHCPADLRRTAAREGPSSSVQVWWQELPVASFADQPDGHRAQQSHQPGDLFEIGNTTVNYNLTRDGELLYVCEFLVSVLDITPPEISNCSNDETHTLSTETSAKVSWVEPEATDNSGEVSLVSQSHEPGDPFLVGGTSVEYVYRDPSGNVNLCSFIIRVLDITPPLITNCPNDATHDLSAKTGTEVTWIEPEATDNSGEVSLVSQSHELGDLFPLGGTSVEYMYSDPSGNRNLCSFVIRVVDVIPPTIHQCPDDKTLTSEHALKYVTWPEPYATDNSGQPSLVRQTHRPGDSFLVGSTAVQYVFKDPSGNIKMCSFFVKGKIATTQTSCNHGNGASSGSLLISNYGVLIFSVLFTHIFIFMILK